MPKETARQKMSNVLVAFIKYLDAYPGWREYQKKKISYVMSNELREIGRIVEMPGMFSFSNEVERQHNLIMLYLYLEDSIWALKDVEFYFRRYPFYDLPVSHDRHLTYIVEMYFSRFYAFRSRLKNYLNALNDMIDKNINIGRLLKQFDKDFDAEIRGRNQVHHHQAFGDIDVDYLYITGILPDEKGWGSERSRAYRRTTKEWVDRVRKKSKHLEEYLEAVAAFSLSNCLFLQNLRIEETVKK